MTTKDQTLHMIGNAHIDPVWLWRWQEGYHEALASFRSALDRLAEDPEFLFVSSSAQFYAWVEENNPAMFEEIRQRVREGRWEIVGGWWIQPDCNIPSGESFVRQALYGQRYFKSRFGVTARVGYNVDSFGHHGMLPQLLKKSGLDYYVFTRPNPQEMGMPSRLFWWESDDGSQVLAYRIPFEYCTWGKELDKHVRRAAGELRSPFDSLMCFYGVGNHGGGPTKENLESIRRLDAAPDLPRLVFSTPNRYFDCVERQNLPIPTLHRELQHHASGTYSVHSGIKRWNRRAEWALVTAEKWAALATVTTGLGYPLADLGRAWQGVLFNQFHDILAGTSIESAYEDARNLHGEAMTIADRALNAATQSLAWNIGIPQAQGTTPIIVFNPHAWDSRVNVEVEFGRFTDEYGLLDDQRHPVPVQRVQSEATSGGRNRLSFTADLPALGYRVYHVAPNVTRPEPPAEFQASDTVLENRRFRLTINPTTGVVQSLYDKQAETEAFTGDAAIPVVVEDRSDTWSHNVFSFRQQTGVFKPTSIRLVERGPVKSVVRVVSEYGRSRLIQDFTLYADLDYVDVRVTVDWQEEFKALKLRFPINCHFHRVTHEIPYGSVDRFANGEEEPGQSWVDVSGSSRQTGDRFGVSVINDSKYSQDVYIRDIGLTVLRSPIYAHHDPMVPQDDGLYTFIDQMTQRFCYRIYPHIGGWEEAGTVQRAAELNQRPITLIGTYHPQGTLPQVASFVRAEPANVVVSVLKQAEDDDALILRAYETTRAATRASITLPTLGRAIEAQFGPCEIKTFRIPRDSNAPVTEVNLIEWADDKQ